LPRWAGFSAATPPSAIDHPEGFWAEHGKRLDWLTCCTEVKNTSFDAHNVSIKSGEAIGPISLRTQATNSLRSSYEAIESSWADSILVARMTA
jgi:hypothetical protein